MRAGWLILGVTIVVAMAACGGPEVTDLDGNPIDGTPTPTPSGTGTGTPTPTPTPSGTTPVPGSTLPPGVPSFAVWDSSVRNATPASCGAVGNNGCHKGGSGGFSMIRDDASVSNRKYYWFTSLCNRDSGTTPGSGVQAYVPPTGKMRQVYCNQVAHSGGAVPQAACDAIVAWLDDGTVSPPLCANAGLYDLDASQ